MTDKDIKDIFKNFPDLDKGFEKLKQEVPAMTMDHLRELQELEIAAREYSFQDKHFLHNGSVLAVDSLCVCAEDAFIAGANWQKQQMKAYVINLNRRTLEYIYDVCKGVMPSKELFIKCVMSTIKED